MHEFAQYTINGITVGCFFALVALGYTMVYGVVRLINFAHGEIAMIGAFVGWGVLTSLPGAVHVWSLVLVFVVAMSVSAAANVGVFVVVYRPMLGTSVWAILIAALGVSAVLKNGAKATLGPELHAYPEYMSNDGFTIAGASVTWFQVILVAVSVALLIGLYVFVNRTTVGTAMRAVSVDHDAARLCGLDVTRLVALAFLIGGALAGAAGVMIGLYYRQIQFDMGFLLGIQAFTAAVIGGIGNVAGAMTGAMTIGLLDAYVSGYLSGSWAPVTIFALLIGFLVLRPGGLLGERVAERM